ncbi:MAG: helix-turn-helix domain-containing protein [Bacteroidetes bacterium]|nr:helix-turn-helix domain-containing protein [Bacteroidota bacterium]
MNKNVALKYRVIQNYKQYNQYCEILESLLEENKQTIQIEDEIDLLTVLIEKYDDEQTTQSALDPVQLLYSFMADQNMNASDLSKKLDVGKSYLSEILNYKKSFPKEIIRRLATLFNVKQEAFNREYLLRTQKITNPGKTKHASNKSHTYSVNEKMIHKNVQEEKEVYAIKKSKQKVKAKVKAKI